MDMAQFIKRGAVIFALSGVLNIFADFLPGLGMQLANLLGVACGLVGLSALYVHIYGIVKTDAYVGFIMAMLGFTGIAGFLFTDAFVFTALPTDTVDMLTNGSTGLAIFAAVILYVLGVLSLTFSAARSNTLPKAPLFMWAGGTLPTLAAIALPAFVMTLAEVIASVGIVWISAVIFRQAAQSSPTADLTV